jgi:hypothetical protein
MIKIGSVDVIVDGQVNQKFLIMKLATRVWPLNVCSRGGALLAYLILKRGGCSDLKIKRAKRRN